jgi:CRISPR-associated protein Csx10
LGKVQITATSGTETADIVSRITPFNYEFKKRWQNWEVLGKPPQDLMQGRTYFTLDLQSDAIFTENWQRTTVISPIMLRQLANVDDSSLELHVAYTSYDYRSGWNAAWGLMKDVELVTNKGAVYLFSTTQLEAWIKALEQLEMRGVGERTCEGFGQVQICNEFHLVFREDAV